MTKLMDINPLKRGTEETGMAESRFKRVKNFCAGCCPKSWQGLAVALLAAVILWQLLVSWGLLPSLSFPLADSDKWQAVFLTNGQVYFGHIKESNRDYAVLSNVYYLRVSQQLQPPEQQPQQQINLVKLGEEVYGPEDKMYIPKSQIIHWENMKTNSPVSQAIKQIEESAKK